MTEYPKELMELARWAYAIGPRPLVFTEMQERFRLELATLLQATWQRSRDYTAVLENSIRLNNKHDALHAENDALRKVVAPFVPRCKELVKEFPRGSNRAPVGSFYVTLGDCRNILSTLDAQEGRADE